MRFVDTHRFSPVANKIDLPWEDDLFHHDPQGIPTSAKERVAYMNEHNIYIDDDWWQKQYDRCMNGITFENAIERGGDAYIDGIDAIWSGNDCYVPQYDIVFKDGRVHLTGRQYFYLNFWKIYAKKKDQKVKDVIVPRFLDLDYFFFRRWYMMEEQSKDSQELKGRQLGFSEKGAGGIIGYNYTFIPASVNVIVGGEATDAEHTFENCERGLDDLINTQFYLQRAIGGDSSSVKKSRKTASEIRALTAKDKPQTASRYSPYLVWYEEIGKGKKGWSLDVAEFVKPSIYAEDEKTGYQIYIGTGGEMEEGAQDLEQRHYDPDEENILSFENKYEPEGVDTTSRVGHFTPKWMFRVIDKDGNSLRKESIEKIRAEYAALKKPKKKYIFTTQNPIYASEAFLISSGGFFGEAKVQMLNERKAWLNNHKGATGERKISIDWIDPKKPWAGVTWKDDPDGFATIYELPELDEDGNVYKNLYGAATDSYDQDEAHTSTSMGSCQIKKGFLDANHTYNKHVARITERPGTAEGGKEKFYEHTAMLCVMYNAINLIEFSKILVIDWYIQHGLGYMLKERPEFVTAAMIKKSKASNKYGIDPSTKIHWLTLLSESLTYENIQKMDDVELITALAKYRYDPSGKKYNCDITITAALLEVLQKDEEHIKVIRHKKENTERPYRAYKFVNGTFQTI